MKKKKGFWQLGGLLPISQSWSRYNILYRDTTGAPGHDTAERVRNGAGSKVAIRPATRTTRSACARGERCKSRYNSCIMAGATFGVVIRRSKATIQRCDTAAARYDTAIIARGMGLGVKIQFGIATRGADIAGGGLRHSAHAP